MQAYSNDIAAKDVAGKQRRVCLTRLEQSIGRSQKRGALVHWGAQPLKLAKKALERTK